MADTVAFFRNIPIFAELSDEDLELVCSQVEEVRLEAGQELFEEGEMGEQAYLIREGQIEIYKTANDREVQVAVRQQGEMIGETSLLESVPRNASARALTDCDLYAIGQGQLDIILNTNPSAARTMLHTMILRLRSLDLLLSQSEKMAQLGTLTAGVAHELNNPASAVKRGADQFNETFTRFQEVTTRLIELDISADQLRALRTLTENSGREVSLGSIERSDREQAFEEWLDEIGVDDGWEKAPALVSLGYDPQQLKQALEQYSQTSLPAVIEWITFRADLNNITDEISQGAGRISQIVKALKSYTYLDQAPVQSVNIKEGLEETLVILRHKLKDGIEVEKVYDPSVPVIQAYGSELNQVWTNIIANAIDSMAGKGKITIRTEWRDPWILVDIADQGPGIPPELQSKLFSPFFTTKPLGKGTGLGLYISYNIVDKHGGKLKVTSKPGDTHFEVWLPADHKKE